VSEYKTFGTIGAALAHAQAVADSVEKDGFNGHHRYAYASAEAIIAEAKDALSAASIAVIPVSHQVVDMHGGQELQSTWRVMHAGGLDTLDLQCAWPVVPGAGKQADKAVAAARTASLGYLLRDLLLMPRVEEGTGLDDDKRDAPPPKAPPPPPAPKEEVDRKHLVALRGLLADLPSENAINGALKAYVAKGNKATLDVADAFIRWRLSQVGGAAVDDKTARVAQRVMEI
jgi:hypothetical protein